MEKLNVKELDFCAHDIEEDSFEKFDQIYDAVMDDQVQVAPENIGQLCDIFKKPFEGIHPHQYIKICKITFFVIQKIGEEEGFNLLIKGLVDMPKRHVRDYLKMLKCSYQDKQIQMFMDKLQSLPTEEREYIKQCWNECAQS